jgi:hypothetical protein
MRVAYVSKAATDMALAETGFFSKNWIWRRVLTFEGSLGRREDSFIRDARLCVCRYTETYFYFVRCTSIFCDILTLHRGFTRSCHDPQRSYLVFPHLLSYLNRPTCGRANSLPMLQVPASSLSLSLNSTAAPQIAERSTQPSIHHGTSKARQQVLGHGQSNFESFRRWSREAQVQESAVPRERAYRR